MKNLHTLLLTILSFSLLASTPSYTMMDCEDIDATICSTEVFILEQDTFNIAGSYELTSTTCEGMFTLNLTVDQKVEPNITEVTLCEDEDVFWNGQWYPAGITSPLIIVSDDCNIPDEILILTVLTKPDPIIENVVICNGESFTWAVNGVTYSETVTVDIENDGCKANNILVLTVPIAGPLPPESCFGEVEFDEATCLWDVEGYYPIPNTECYQTVLVDTVTCLWVVSGEMPTEPEVLCFESPIFDNVFCDWVITGESPTEPPTECYQTVTWNDTICDWEISGDQPENPYPGCFVFDDIECHWKPEGLPNLEDIENCNQTITILENCEWEISGDGMCNFVTGTVTIDLNDDGCDKTDQTLANLEIQNAFYSTFTNDNGEYTLHTELDSMVISLDTTQFNLFFPQDTVIYFDDMNVQQLDFCITPKPSVDACLILCPLPTPNGYFVMVRNYGNTIMSGEVTLEAEHTMLQSTMPPVTSFVDSLFTWSFEDVEPFGETRIDFVLEFDETLMIGDKIELIATVTPDQIDDNPQNNQITKIKTITSFTDPNPNTTALVEGSPIPPTSIGEFVNFVVQFENESSRTLNNTSTIVLRDTLSTEDFDVTTFEPVLFSHNCTVDLCGPEIMVEFNDNIPSGESGFFAYKIRLADDLVEGDTIRTQASIYIDFNPPILADPAEAVIGNLVVSSIDDLEINPADIDLEITPNPTSDIFNIELGNLEGKSNTISIYSDQGQLMTTLTTRQPQIQFDASLYSSGIYIVKVQVGDRIASRKLVIL